MVLILFVFDLGVIYRSQQVVHFRDICGLGILDVTGDIALNAYTLFVN